MAVKHGGCGTPEYFAWNAMKQRCHSPKHECYPSYGGRGITVCDRWREEDTGFPNFLADMGKRPSPKHSLDRRNNDLGYNPENCRWATKSVQQFNQRPCRAIHNFSTEDLEKELYRRYPEPTLYGIGC